jgi:hypothetical protein
VDLEDGVACVVLAREEGVLLQAAELGLERCDKLSDLLLALAKLAELDGILELSVEPLVALKLARQSGVLGRDAGCARVVVPEPWRAHLLLELGPANP